MWDNKIQFPKVITIVIINLYKFDSIQLDLNLSILNHVTQSFGQVCSSSIIIIVCDINLFACLNRHMTAFVVCAQSDVSLQMCEVFLCWRLSCLCNFWLVWRCDLYSNAGVICRLLQELILTFSQNGSSVQSQKH